MTNHNAPAARAEEYTDVPDLRLFVFALFFIFGGITSLNDIVVPKLKGLFTLTYGQAMLVQFAFFLAYFVISLPGAANGCDRCRTIRPSRCWWPVVAC